MSNLEEKIQNLSTQLIEQKVVACFLLLLNNALEKQEEIHYEIHEDILALQNKVHHYVLDLESILEKKETRLAALEDCIQLKKDILFVYETIYQYISLWNLYSIKINNEFNIRKFKKDNFFQEENIDWNAFYIDCVGFLKEAPNELEQRVRMSDIIKCLPFQMARAKYYNILEKNMDSIFQSEPEEIIERSLNIFAYSIIPEKNKNFGKYFPDIANWLLAHKDSTPKEYNDEQLEAEYEDFDTIFNELSAIKDMLSSLLDDTNSLLILFYIGYSFTELTEKNVAYADYYHTVCEMPVFSELEKEAYWERLKTSLENEIEAVLDKAKEINEKQIKYLQKVNDFSEFGEDTRKILWTEDFVRKCYFSNLDEDLLQFDVPEDAEEAPQECRKNKIHQFIEEVKTYLGTLAVADRKITMQILLGLFPLNFTVDELLSMVKTTLDNTTEKVLILDRIGAVMSSYGYGQEEEEHHHHHHHHDHCNCTHP